MKIIDEAPVAKKRRGYTTKLTHPTYVIEPCSRCGFPEADGGYCGECGQTFQSTVSRRQKR